ncbi:MAG: type II secretion system protein [Ruminiclostridium sp.]|nr:type II secretion system protein [Ruminiclostridium sp.]
MIRFFAKRRHRKGFTLTEVIVVTAIVAFLMAAVAAFAGPVRTVIRNTNAKSDTNTINKIIGDYIEHRLAYANDIDIYVAAPYNPGSGDMYDQMEQSYEDMEKYAQLGTKPTDNQINNPRVMIFKFVDETSVAPLTPASDKLQATYVVYDYPIKAGSTAPSDFNTLCTDEYKLFKDDFYAGYQYFMTMDDIGIQSNAVRNRAYLNFRIDSYYCQGDSTDKRVTKTGDVIGLNADHIKKYHQYVDKILDAGATELIDPMDDMAYEKTASENVSFSLENISNPKNVKLVRGDKTYTGDTLTSYKYGTDIYVFYNVRTYRIGKDK